MWGLASSFCMWMSTFSRTISYMLLNLHWTISAGLLKIIWPHTVFFWTVKMHPPQNLGGKWGGVLYSECGFHLQWWNIMLFMLLSILPHFLLQKFFSYFPPLKPRCVFWSEKYSMLDFISGLSILVHVFICLTSGQHHIYWGFVVKFWNQGIVRPPTLFFFKTV